MRGAVITGVGTALPEKVLTNHDLESMMDTSDEWITERTGIRERRIGGTTAGLSAEAAAKALEAAGCDPADIDLLIVATTSPDQQCPGTSAAVAHELGINCGAFDLNSACTGWVSALITGHGWIAQGMDKVLVVGAETLSRMTDYSDRGTGILFADGAGAAVLEAVDGPGQMMGFDIGTDGSLRHILYADHGGVLTMDGREVFRRAVRVMVDSANKVFERAGVTPEDIDVVIPHQANIRIIESAVQKLGLSMDKTAVVLDRTGNTSAATVPLALDEAISTGRVHPGDKVLFVGFGAGMTWASAVVTWGGQ
ncbi:MAG: beta-ketoacyl-ACP synthase III [Actinomycetota bacterium]|nr:beta-ketoacyl-ACP synthase III [Actinomycetota bacterium]